jgi:hypothetical protein
MKSALVELVRFLVLTIAGCYTKSDMIHDSRVLTLAAPRLKSTETIHPSAPSLEALPMPDLTLLSVR